MKHHFGYWIAIAMFTAIILSPGSAPAATNTNGLVSAFDIVGVYSPTNSPVSTTNNVGNVVTSIYTAKPLKIATKDMLNLLEAEFGTSFPLGAKLAFDLNSPQGFVVIDSGGNLILNVSSNTNDSSYRFSLTNSSSATAISGKQVQTTTTSSTNTVQNVSETVADYAIYYADGKGNKFHFNGTLVLKANADYSATGTDYKTISIVLSGTGGGTFFNPMDGKYDSGVFTKALWVATGKNVVQP